LVVELMRQGRPPDEACREAIGRMIAKGGVVSAHMSAVIALDRHGVHAGHATRPGFSYAASTPAGLSYTDIDVPG